MNLPSPSRGRVAALGAATAALLLLSACSGTATGSVSGPGLPPSTVTVTPTPSTAGSSSADPSDSQSSTPPDVPSSTSQPTSSTPTTASTGFRAERCDTADLRGSLQYGDGAAGSTVYDLQLQNTGSAPCTLQGWPGVSLISTRGSQIGAAADFDRSSAHQTVTLLPNGHAHASLKVARAGNYPQAKCSPVHAAQVRVYPPGSRASLTVPTRDITGCNSSSVHLLTVQALHATT